MSAAAAAPTDRTCSTCGARLRPVSVGHGGVTVDTVAAAVTGPGAWECPHAADATPAPTAGADDGGGFGVGSAGGHTTPHDRIAPTSDEARAAAEEALVPARRTMVRGTLRCGVCDTPFALPGRRTTRSVTVEWAGPPVTLTLDLPVLRCTEDAVDNVPPEALQDALAAIDLLLGGDR